MNPSPFNQMSEPYFSFVEDRPAPDQTPIRISPRRNMFLRPIGEDALRHAPAGEEITVRRCDLARIDPEDYDVAEA